MDLTPFLVRSPVNHGLGRAKSILVEYGVRPAQKDGSAAYDRAFTEETCILIALVNGFDRVVILNYPHKSHFKNGIHEPHPNHITAAFGHRSDKIEKAHVYLSEVRPYIICRREEDEKIDVVWGGHLGYTFEPVLSFSTQAWLDPVEGSATGLMWKTVRVNETRRKLKTTGILNLDNWRTTAAEINKVIVKEEDSSSDWFRYGMGKGIRDFRRTTITTPDRRLPTLQSSGYPTPPPVLDFIRAHRPNPSVTPKDSDTECKDFTLPLHKLKSSHAKPSHVNPRNNAPDDKDSILPRKPDFSRFIPENIVGERKEYKEDDFVFRRKPKPIQISKADDPEDKENKENNFVFGPIPRFSGILRANDTEDKENQEPLGKVDFEDENKENDVTKDFILPQEHGSNHSTLNYSDKKLKGYEENGFIFTCKPKSSIVLKADDTEVKENRDHFSKGDYKEENKENEGAPKRKPKPKRVQPLRASRTSQNSQGVGNWRDTMKPLHPSPVKKEDPWRTLQRLCKDMPSFAKEKEDHRPNFSSSAPTP